jgi:hypothetical protein
LSHNKGSTAAPSSTSNENECTLITLACESRSMSLATDNLMNATGMMSCMGSFMAPPSQLDTSELNEDSIIPEYESFNASVRMGGTTTFGWRGGDDKTRFCFNSPNTGEEEQVSRDFNRTGPPPAFEMLPPPPPAPKREKLKLYESISESQSKSLYNKNKETNALGRQPLNSVDFRALTENVAPLSPPIQPPQPVRFQPLTPAAVIPTPGKSVSARVAEFEAASSLVVSISTDFTSFNSFYYSSFNFFKGS